MTRLSEEHQQIIDEEEAILAATRRALKDEVLNQHLTNDSASEEIKRLLVEARHAHERDLGHLLEQIHSQAALQSRHKPRPLPEIETPYFAHMVLEEKNKTRHILLGYSSFVTTKSDYPIIDWRNAPLAQVFFKSREGDDFEQQLPGRIARGVVKNRRVLTIQNGELIEIRTRDDVLTKTNEGWIEQKIGNFHLHGGESKAVRKFSFGLGATNSATPEIAALLDQDQFEILNSDPYDPLLVLGCAGSGKTTVSLHRVSALAFKEPEHFQQERMVLIVPHEGLVRLSKNLLRQMRMSKVHVHTLDDWMRIQAERVLPRLPKKVYEWTPPSVVNFKRHPAMEFHLSAYIRKVEMGIQNRIAKVLPSHMAQDEFFRRYDGDSMHRWLKGMRRKVEKVEKERGIRMTLVQDTITAEIRDLFDLKSDREKMFVDKELLQTTAHEFDLPLGQIQDVILHTTAQMSQGSREKYANVDDESRRQALDGKDITQDDDDRVSRTIDYEDYPIFLELLWRKTGALETKKGRIRKYAHMVLDETQEIAPLELKALGRSLMSPKSITIAGDLAQQSDPNASFDTWERALTHLGLKNTVTSHHLQTNYRSPEPVCKYAYDVLGGMAGPLPKSLKPGVPVKTSKFRSYGTAVVAVLEELETLMESEPNASVCVVTRDEDNARMFYKDLSRLNDVRLVEKGEFDFSPGIDIAPLNQVKGLEFDYVIVADADTHSYGEDDISRRALHVACTRAVHQLWVISFSSPSLILPKGVFES